MNCSATIATHYPLVVTFTTFCSEHHYLVANVLTFTTKYVAIVTTQK